jgi:histidine triad (HIT) family protein
MKPSDCPFCARIAAAEYEHLYQGNGVYYDVVRFRPLNPVVPGHMLFVPRRHVEDAGVEPELTARVMHFASDWAGGLLASFNIITSAGELATQTVFHLHLHVVPRREGDGLRLPWTGQAR